MRPLNFKEFYLKETDALEGKVKMLVYGQNFILFFRFDGDVYGGGEDARLTYATMKSGGEDGTEEMVFGVHNLSQGMSGQASERYFTADDIEHIEVITNREAEHLLNKHGMEAK